MSLSLAPMTGSSLASMMASSWAQMMASKMASSWALVVATSSYNDGIKLLRQQAQAWHQRWNQAGP
eukprot:2750230-Ditylum_brightwellii.AAC.1